MLNLKRNKLNKLLTIIFLMAMVIKIIKSNCCCWWKCISIAFFWEIKCLTNNEAKKILDENDVSFVRVFSFVFFHFLHSSSPLRIFSLKIHLFFIIFFSLLNDEGFFFSDTWTGVWGGLREYLYNICCYLLYFLVVPHTLQHVICNLEGKPLRSLWKGIER